MGVGLAIITAAIVGAGFLLVTADPDWILALPVVGVAVLFIAVVVMFFIVVYRHHLIL